MTSTAAAPTPEQVLALPMNPERNDAGADSVRSYLVALLDTLWKEGEGFGGKRPFGNSGWEYELYLPLATAGFIDAELDEDGHLEECDDKAGDRLIAAAIGALTVPASPLPAGPAAFTVRITPEGVLRQVLDDIVRHDTDYATRYVLVFQAVPLALQCGYVAGIRTDPAEPEWPVVYIELPTGQVSWHMPRYANEFDGHGTPEKFARIRAYLAGPERE